MNHFVEVTYDGSIIKIPEAIKNGDIYLDKLDL